MKMVRSGEVEVLNGCQVGCHVSVVKDMRHRILFIWVLFWNELIVIME